MKCTVIGAGAWGLPAAAELIRRGHDVTLVERYGILNPLSSSAGPTRMWRLADPDPTCVRLAVRSIEAMHRLEDRSGEKIVLRRGLLWRDSQSVSALLSALSQFEVEHTQVSPADVGKFFPGLRPDGRDAVWSPDAGVVLAAKALRAQHGLFVGGGGVMELGREVTTVAPCASGVRVAFREGAPIESDRVVIAAGPGASNLLRSQSVDIPLQTYLEQVVHFGDPSQPNAFDDYPCLFDGPHNDRHGIYAMPSPGIGYKVGLDTPLREYAETDTDRSPEARRTRIIQDRVRADLTAISHTVIDAQVCSWTDSPDGKFILDVLDGGVVVACGDSGVGFKYSALIGELLADLVEDRSPPDDVSAFSLARFVGGIPVRSRPHGMGSHPGSVNAEGQSGWSR